MLDLEYVWERVCLGVNDIVGLHWGQTPSPNISKYLDWGEPFQGGPNFHDST